MPNIRYSALKDTPYQRENISAPKTPLLDTLGLLDQKSTTLCKTPKLKYKVLTKYLTHQIIYPLIDLHTPMERSYWTAWRCGNILVQNGQRLTTTYCKHRVCIQCNRIRTAELMNGYLPQIERFTDSHFVTLTTPNVRQEYLREEFEHLIKTFGLIMRKAKRKGLRNTALRKIECTYNPKRNTYNPHIHVIADNLELATFIRNEWLKRNVYASRRAQDIRRADTNSAMELFKYFTKLVHINHEQSKSGEPTKVELQPRALDSILSAIKGKRTFQTYGTLKLISEDIEKIESQEYPELDNDIAIWNYTPVIHNYVNHEGLIMSSVNAPEVYQVVVK